MNKRAPYPLPLLALLTALMACSLLSAPETAEPASSPTAPATQAPAETPLPEAPGPTAAPPTAAPPQETLPPTEPATVEVTVFFTDGKRYAAGTPPFEAAVTRRAPAGADLPRAVLEEFFKGPTEEERALGVEWITSGFTGFRELIVREGVARVYLIGPCRSNGAVYTIAAPLIANLTQFAEIRYVKIYDEEGTTEQPDGPGNSIPFCLEP